MIRQTVASSIISSVGYDSETRVLEVETRQQGVRLYYDVPLTTWHFFMAAPSKGDFYLRHIQHHFSHP